MLRQLPGEDKSHGSLDLPGRDRGLLVVAGQAGSLLRELLEDVVYETVHNSHGLAGDADIGVDLLQNFENVDLVSFGALLRLLLLLLVSGGCGVFGWEFLLRLGLLFGRGFLGGLLLLCRFLGGGLLLCWLLIGLGRHR